MGCLECLRYLKCKFLFIPQMENVQSHHIYWQNHQYNDLSQRWIRKLSWKHAIMLSTLFKSMMGRLFGSIICTRIRLQRTARIYFLLFQQKDDIKPLLLYTIIKQSSLQTNWTRSTHSRSLTYWRKKSVKIQTVDSSSSREASSKFLVFHFAYDSL